MTIRDRITRVRARAPGVEDYPASMAVHRLLTDPTLCGTFGNTVRCTNDGSKPTRGQAYAGSRLKLSDALGRHRRKCQPSSRTGENPPYGMIGGIEETSASCEARSAPRSYPTAEGEEKSSSLPRPSASYGATSRLWPACIRLLKGRLESRP